MVDLRKAFFGKQTTEQTRNSEPGGTTPRSESIPGKNEDDSPTQYSAPASDDEGYPLMKDRIHNRLVKSLDIEVMTRLTNVDELEAAVQHAIHVLIDEENLPLSLSERKLLATDVLNETLGLGPLEQLLQDPDVNDILVSGANCIEVDKRGKIYETNLHFKDNNHLMHVINRMVARIGRRVDEASPFVDARLPDGSRIHAIIPPLSVSGPILSIRLFRPKPYTIASLIDAGTLSAEMGEFLRLAVQAKLNILIAGGTGAGKTTMLNALSAFIKDSDRIITIEDTAELRLQQKRVIRLEARAPNFEGSGLVTQRTLIVNALRMRPDRIVIGEVRGPEALDMLQAMNTGHAGSLSTLHANSPRSAVSRLETLVLLGGIELSQRSIREQIGNALHLMLQMKRMADGSCKLIDITEVTGCDDGIVMMQTLFEYKFTVESDGLLQGRHVKSGYYPRWKNIFTDAGIELPAELFS